MSSKRMGYGSKKIKIKHKGIYVTVEWNGNRGGHNKDGIIPASCHGIIRTYNNSGHDYNYVNVIIKVEKIYSDIRPSYYYIDKERFHVKKAPRPVGEEVEETFTLNPFSPYYHLSIERVYGEREDGKRFDTSSLGYRAQVKGKNWGKYLGIPLASLWMINKVLVMSGHHTLQWMMLDCMGLTGTHCAVATAACGDENHPIVKEFRRFRSEVLMKNPVGSAFCSWYYRNGPTLAAPLAKSPALRALVRGPLIAGAGAIRLGRRLLSSVPTRQP